MKFVFILYHRKTSKKSQNQWKNWFEIRFFISSEHHSLNCWKYAFFITELLDNTDKRNQTTVGNLIKNLIKLNQLSSCLEYSKYIFIHLTLHAFLVQHKDMYFKNIALVAWKKSPLWIYIIGKTIGNISPSWATIAYYEPFILRFLIICHSK